VREIHEFVFAPEADYEVYENASVNFSLSSPNSPRRAWACQCRLLGDVVGEKRAAELGIGVVVEVHGGVDRHPVALAGAAQSRVAVALAG
jgi:hypothetical protein